MLRWIEITFVAFGLATICLPVKAFAAEMTAAQIENRRCLNCHGQSRIAEMSPADRQSMVATRSPVPEFGELRRAATTTTPTGTGETFRNPTTQSVTAVPPSSSYAPVAPPALKRPGLFVSEAALAGSVHGTLSCVSCHVLAQTLPHPQAMGAVSCATAGCHSPAQSDYLQGVHALAAAKPGMRDKAPTCATCHGGHDILPKSDRRSRTFPLNIVKVCGDCHEKHTSTDGRDGPTRVESYLESVHGRAVSKSGLAVAATCADCHGNHKVLAATDAASKVNRTHVADTCGKCHIGLEETYNASVHGQELARGNTKAPVCTDCHTAHHITRTDTPTFMLDIVTECGQCHDKLGKGGNTTRLASLYETYRRSYHGQVTALGSTRAARCSDCHGAHDIRRIDDPASRLNALNRINTCRQCHKGADAKFAMFAPHADLHDSQRYPLLHGVWLYFVIMMSFAFGFFGLHSILWFGRSLIERFTHGPLPRFHGNGTAIKRFNRVDRINHAFVIISFFGLSLTGLPLLYADKSWAQGLINAFGGVRACGVLHRFFAVILIANFVVHGVGLVRRFKKLGVREMLFGPATMLPRAKDVKDCLGMFRWFFFAGPKPTFDRWTYWEKFDYVAEVGGSMIIGFTGLLLWFPIFFSHYLPGWIFNVATIVHGYEALLAVGFIFTIHFFNAHLRLEKFPVDDVMFTGRLPEEEFKHERGVEYARLVATGELEKLRVPPAPRWYRYFAVIMGAVAMAIGLTIVALIILAGLRWI
jgi:cytochrome b subunit of formate dehydrogenase